MKNFKNVILLFLVITSFSFLSCENEPLEDSLQSSSDSKGLPIITTKEVININMTKATSGGDVIYEGDYPILSKGVVWSTNPNPSLTNSIYSTSNGEGTGSFSSNMGVLFVNTTYYVRAYASTSKGTVYGNQIEFLTETAAGTYDFTNYIHSSPVDLNNDGISSLDVINELPTNFDEDKILLNANNTFTFTGTDINNVNGALAFHDYTLTGTWSTYGNILTLKQIYNGQDYLTDYLIKDNKIVYKWPAGEYSGYLNGQLVTTIYQSEVTEIYTKQ